MRLFAINCWKVLLLVFSFENVLSSQSSKSPFLQLFLCGVEFRMYLKGLIGKHKNKVYIWLCKKDATLMALTLLFFYHLSIICYLSICLSIYLSIYLSSIIFQYQKCVCMYMSILLNELPGLLTRSFVRNLPGGAVVKNLPANAGDMGSIPGPGRSTCYRATKPLCHNYWACTLEPTSHSFWSLRA